MQRPQRMPQNSVKAYDLGFKNGASHGFDEMKQDVLDWLQAKYITDPNRPERGSAEGKALLEIARELQLFAKDLKLKRIP